MNQEAFVTGAPWALIYSGAKRGKVAPVFSRYGAVLKTHRLFRQYVWALALPQLWNEYSTRSHFVGPVETMWNVHANRMNRGLENEPLEIWRPY